MLVFHARQVNELNSDELGANRSGSVTPISSN